MGVLGANSIKLKGLEVLIMPRHRRLSMSSKSSSLSIGRSLDSPFRPLWCHDVYCQYVICGSCATSPAGTSLGDHNPKFWGEVVTAPVVE